MFRGIANATLDAKGRMPLPARFREQVIERCGGRVILTTDLSEKCLLLYCEQDWDELQRTVDELPNLSSNARKLQRLLIGHASDLELDGSGRLLVSPFLRELAELEKKVVVVGQTRKIEIWSEDNWQRNTAELLSPESRARLVASEEFGSLSL
ncbi:MAG: division/cell wall cluster transcriptional repressor MraZ [Pseudomonadota bacterium]